MTLPTQYQEYIALSRYARWLPEENRRETWEETVDRYIDFWVKRYPDYSEVIRSLRNRVVDLEVMPSMRAIMTAGPALERDNVAGFNCAYMAMGRQRAYDELVYILMCGTGDGFSVERKYTDNLPTVSEEMHETDTTIVVSDSKIGWASAYRELISLLYAGKVPKWDVSKVRAKGEPLKTFGGRASGPEPLVELFKYTVNTFNRYRGRRLDTIAVHDLACKIAEIVVVGGVRRSALISLSDLDDPYMQKAKSPFKVIEYTLLEQLENGDRRYSIIVDDAPYGERSVILTLNDWESGMLQSEHTVHWRHIHPERALANNSVAYEGKPGVITYLKEFTSLVESYSGERGIFSREASQRQADKNGRRDASHTFGTNPCSEIILRDRQFCNLSEVVVRNGDTYEQLRDKVRIATIFGTLQATLTDFRYLSKKWKENTEEEALLGVSLTGIMDHKHLSGQYDYPMIEDIDGYEKTYLSLEEVLEGLKEVAIETNKEWAERLGINPAAAITCVKPSGTVSQLVDSASGIHPRHNPHYLRTVRADKKDPLSQYMRDAGFYVEDNQLKPDEGDVFYFPMKAPEDGVFRNDRSAIEQLEHWLIYQRHWCEHKPSVTIYVKDDEWTDVAAWTYKHFDELSGVSFLPYDGGTYDQAPYQDISKEEYEEWLERMPKNIDWSRLSEYENQDMTEGAQQLACVSGICEI